MTIGVNAPQAHGLKDFLRDDDFLGAVAVGLRRQ